MPPNSVTYLFELWKKSTIPFESNSKSTRASWSSCAQSKTRRSHVAYLMSTETKWGNQTVFDITKAPSASQIQILIPTQFEQWEEDVSTLHLYRSLAGTYHNMLLPAGSQTGTGCCRAASARSHSKILISIFINSKIKLFASQNYYIKIIVLNYNSKVKLCQCPFYLFQNN